MRPDGTQQDQMLLAQLRSGDQAAFAALVRRWTPAMLRLADNYVPSREVSEEVVQDSWMAVLKGIAAFEGRSTVRTWVFRIVVRRAQQTGIKERRSVPFSSAWQQERGASVDPSRFHPAQAAANAGGWINPVPRWDHLPDERWGGAELRTAIQTAIDALPRRQREVITARDIFGCPAEEVCSVLNVSANHQRVLLHRARAHLRTAIETHLATEPIDG